MEILERYLQAVKKYLPWQRQDDIIAELRANLEAQIEDAEAEHGRPLASAEVEDLLKKMGPPMLVAGRFQPQRSLIGPTLGEDAIKKGAQFQQVAKQFSALPSSAAGGELGWLAEGDGPDQVVMCAPA